MFTSEHLNSIKLRHRQLCLAVGVRMYETLHLFLCVLKLISLWSRFRRKCIYSKKTSWIETASINVSVCRGSEQNKKSPSYGLADFGHRTRDDKCALAIIQSALIIL